MKMSIVKRLLQQETIPKTLEVFQIDGIPLWYFLEPLAPAWYLPKPHQTWREIERDIKNNRPPSSLNKLKFDISAFAVLKGLIINEKIKFLISSKKSLRGVGKRDVLFIVTTDEIFEERGKLKFSVIDGIINALELKKIKPLVLVHDPLPTLSSFKLKKYSPLLYAYITPEILEESKKLSNELNKKWKALDEELKIKQFTYEGKSYWKFLEKNMDFLFSKELLFTLIKYYLTFKKILEDHDVKVAYLTSIMGIKELSLMGAAYKLDRGIVYSLHGYAKIPQPAYIKTHFKKREFLKNVFFASEKAEGKKLLEGGMKKEHVFVTGSPFFDKIADYKRKSPSRAKKVIALLTTSLVESRHIEKKKYFELIRKALAQIGQVKEVEKLIIKLHPGEKHKSKYESIARSLNLKDVEITQEPGKVALYSVMSDSDLLLGFGSTALLEGMMLDKDVIHLEKFVEGLGEFEFTKGTLRTKKLDNLAELIRRVLTDKKLKEKLKKKRKKYLRESFYKVDGKAHERVADLIEKVATMSQRKT